MLEGSGGSAIYDDHYPGDRDQPRIVVIVAIGRGIECDAIVDTGAPWNIVSPDLARAAGLMPESPAADRHLVIRGTSWDGTVVRGSLRLIAQTGDDLEIEGSFFVPVASDDQPWNQPNFIGYGGGALERVRFAVDPSNNTFWFGPL